MKPLLDPARHPPELMAYFIEHARRWRNGEIRLVDFLESYHQEPSGELRPLWYPEPLGARVLVDKAALFDMLGYRPSEPACRAHASLAKVRVFSGGARAGKSRWAGFELLPLLLTPDTRIWIVAPEYEQGRKEFEYLQTCIENDEIRKDFGTMIKGGRVANNPKNGDMEIRLNWGDAGESFVKVKSAERPTSLLSEELDAVCVVEASQIREVIWSRYLQMRLTNRQGIAIFPSSPDGTGWYHDLYQAGLNAEPRMFSINADSRMNPTLSLDEIAFWTDSRRMSDEDFEEQVRGRPTPKHGRVYRLFDKATHVDPWRSDWPLPSWQRGRAFDFGYQDPYVVLWIARDTQGSFYVYREFYRSHVLTNDVVEHISKVEGWETARDDHEQLTMIGRGGTREWMNLASVADWDAAERADLRARGIATRKARKDILPGIRTVSEFLRVQGNGKPRVFISPKCTHLIRELQTYQWGAHAEPVDADNHAPDALRYFLHTLAPHRSKLRGAVV